MTVTSTLKALVPLVLGLGLAILPAAKAEAQALPAPGQSETEWRHSLDAYIFMPWRADGTSTISRRSL